MKLKLSTLAVIIAIIFFFYYYFIYVPCQPTVAPIPPTPPIPGNGEESVNGSMEETTPIEGFAVTPLDYETSGEAVTYL